MQTIRQNNQMELAFLTEERGAAPNAAGERHKVCEASGTTENPGNNNERLMEEICEPENVKEATRRVTGNKGSAGTDGMSVEELPKYLSENWERMKAELIEDRYKPQPVRRVEIPKATGGVRRLGIPTVKDRVVQQMVLQVLQKRWDKTFSESSYGFRPGRNAHQAVAQAQEYIEEGNGWVVDMDLEKFFDLVNHDKLMGQVAKRVKDKRVLRLLRGFLNAGVLEEGLVKPREEGTPQGGPISPLLSNLYLDELDRELEKRRHKFVRYADDCNIYVRSQRAGERVMRSMSKYITLKLKLKVNESKSAVAQPHERKILGFSFTSGGKVKKRLAPQTVEKYKRKIREITRRTKGYNKKTIITLKKYLSGWIGYYGRCQTPSVLKELEGWMRRRLRAMIWEQLKNGRRRYAALRKQGVEEELAASTAGSSKGSWRISLSRALTTAFPNAYFAKAGIPKLAVCIKPIN